MSNVKRLASVYSLCRLIYGPTFQVTYKVGDRCVGILDWESADYPNWPSSRGSHESIDVVNAPNSVAPIIAVCRSALRHAETLDWSSRCTDIEETERLMYWYAAKARNPQPDYRTR